MVCLDTNYLILALVPGSREGAELVAWARAGEPLVTPMPAWYEFLCGPVSERGVATVRAFLGEVIPFGGLEAAEAARLFNASGRKRGLRVDAMIAGTAIVAGARLATDNEGDFRHFVAHGLEMHQASPE